MQEKKRVKIEYFGDFQIDSPEFEKPFVLDETMKGISRKSKAVLKQIASKTSELPPLHAVECDIDSLVLNDIVAASAERMRYKPYDQVAAVFSEID